ncbi:MULTISPECIES: helix-turn-helix domain-containing protein [Enterococcaceae]|uniref:Helix-turn-helix transcriptional regulator n=4 Tax=Enterococcus TaxID=1350 RepID=A0AAE4I474_9ENTE|nr:MULTISPECIES: helix-turn-helix transcriptional regulator [Enterococcaceae]MDT2056210.1 helix-turn-helix transcriptional regulator [Enterococcus faecalis]MDT2472655.1 helix-turn-helix transcriptional regulator [Enterococcus avium]MDT2598073.1 helix-turn-helix transcriptional regulator [Enterococcus dongliensis]MDT2643734.1 helix-turn-helix transcriptional regulator [Enterococcus dongliensis]MDT2738232.1 helix-turn-helix transcriptional regulator [Enterococcus pseudoavium]
MTIGEKIKSLRQSKDLTQSGLGELLNVSSQAVSNWERGKGYPDISNVIQISELFQVSLDILIKEDIDFKAALIEDKAEKQVDIFFSSLAFIISLVIFIFSIYFLYKKGLEIQLIFGLVVGILGMVDFGKKIKNRIKK